MKIIKFKDQDLIADLRYIIDTNFTADVDWYCNMQAGQWRYAVSRVQDEINRHKFGQRLVNDIRDEISSIVGSQNIMMQHGVYLRAARPVTTSQESVGWHRESFYGCPEQAFNFWMPLRGVTEENAIKYIPGSETIPDEDIVTSREDDPEVAQFSDGHKIGLLYAPKTILSGVDLSHPIPVPARFGEVAIFPSALIHGAAENRTDKLRISIDMRLIAAEHVKEQKEHFGEDYFVKVAA